MTVDTTQDVKFEQLPLTPAQCRAARALLAWTQDELADASNVTRRTIVDFEASLRAPRAGTLKALCSALEVAGVAFIAEDKAGAGVRLTKPETGPVGR